MPQDACVGVYGANAILRIALVCQIQEYARVRARESKVSPEMVSPLR
jgi:hypothetical protein